MYKRGERDVKLPADQLPIKVVNEMWQCLSQCGVKRCTTLSKVQALGLKEEYKAEDEILKSFVQKTAAIPPAYVGVAWQGLQHDASDIDRIDDFVEYFDRTWINGQYRIGQWNYYDYHGPRTNNHVEGWHSRLKKIVGKSQPNIFEIVDVMRKEQATTEMKLNQFEANAMQPPEKEGMCKIKHAVWEISECGVHAT